MLPILERELEPRALDGWACVAERFELRAELVDLASSATREHRREDYHCDVSSYSVALDRMEAAWCGRLSGGSGLLCRQRRSLPSFRADEPEGTG